MRQRAGFAIAPILIIGLLCLVVTTTIAVISVFQLDAAYKTQTNEQALYLAEGVMSQAMSALNKGMQIGASQYGRNNESLQFAPFPDRPDAVGTVSFDPATPWGFSTNNYDGTQDTGFDNTAVPQGYVNLIARGSFGKSTRILQAFVTIPTYNYVLAVDGPIQSSGPLKVVAEPSMAALVGAVGSPSGPDFQSHYGANIGSNTSILAAAHSLVTGDVVCLNPSDVNLVAPSTVDGVVKQGAVSIPVLPVASFNTQGPNTPPLPPPNAQNVVEAPYNTYDSGNIVVNGDLKLDGCTVFVAGNLHVKGGLLGTGAVVVSGSVQVDTGADLDAANMVALLATGDVTLKGPLTVQKYFQGLVYTEGAFSASNITIAGAFVSATSPTGTGSASGMTLGNNVTVVSIPGAASLPGVSINTTPAQRVEALMSPLGRNYLNQPLPTFGWNNPNPAPTGIPWCPMVALTGDNVVDTAISNAVSKAVPFQYGLGANWASDQVHNSELQYDTSVPVQWIGVVSSTVGIKPWYSMSYCTIQLDPTTNQFVPLVPPVVSYCVVNAGMGPVPCTPAQFFAGMVANSNFPNVTPAQWFNYLQVAQTAYMTEANNLITNPPPGIPTTGTASIPGLALSSFLSDTAPLHIVSWRERL